MTNKFKFLLVVFSFLFQYLSAKEFFVRSSNELNAVLNKVTAGDIIIWKNGSYKNEKISFAPKLNGKKDLPIILRVEAPGKAIFSGNSQIFISGDYLQLEGFLFEGTCSLEKKESVINFTGQGKNANDANHCRVTNCAIINYTLTEESGIDNNFIVFEGLYNELDHCYFTGKTNKGPTVVVNYKQDENFVSGSADAPSTHHFIHHNYFGYRTFSSNGGEQIRVGVSGTSNTHGFNIVEYNLFEDTRIEAEVISNKSCDNVYRFNTLLGNDGALVLRHGVDCFAYGNYINGKSGRGKSGGLRAVNAHQTMFNNYLENIEGGETPMKGPIVIMSGLVDAGINEYHPADDLIMAFNTVVNSVGPAIKIAVGNVSKGKAFVAPKNVLISGNVIINSSGDNMDPIAILDNSATYKLNGNIFTNGMVNNFDGFEKVSTSELTKKENLEFANKKIDKNLIAEINKRLKSQNIQLSEEEITVFNPKWIVTKKDVGVSWMK